MNITGYKIQTTAPNQALQTITMTVPVTADPLCGPAIVMPDRQHPGKIMKILKAAGIFSLSSHLSYAGDSHYFSIGSWGVGEISNQLLIYHGDTAYRTFIPASKAWLAAYTVLITAIVSTITFKSL